MTNIAFDANLKWLFTEVDFLDRFAAASAAGFTAVEYASPYEYAATDLAARLADNGLSQVLINTPAGTPGTEERQGIACFPELTQRFRDDFLRALGYAGELDASFIHVMAGMRPEGVSQDRAFARFVSNIGWAAEQVKGTGVRIVLEAQNKRDAPGFVLETQAHAASVAEAVDPDLVGIMFDVYHAQIDEGDLVTTFRALAPQVFHVQVADPPSRTEPGTGEVNFRTFFDAVADTGYDGWVGCEYRPATTTEAGLHWMSEFTR